MCLLPKSRIVLRADLYAVAALAGAAVVVIDSIVLFSSTAATIGGQRCASDFA